MFLFFFLSVYFRLTLDFLEFFILLSKRDINNLRKINFYLLFFFFLPYNIRVFHLKSLKMNSVGLFISLRKEVVEL